MLKITVITVCYNECEKLKKTIDSVCRQTYSNIEYLIIDGASRDGTIDLIGEYSERKYINFYSEKDYGIYNAMNRGIARASGEYVCFLNAGDVFYNTYVISDMVSYIEENKDVIYYGNTCLVYADGMKEIQDFSAGSSSLKQKLYNGAMPCHQSIFSPRKALINHYFNEKYKVRADYEWLLYSIKKGFVCKNVPVIVSCYDMAGMSGRIKNIKLLQREEEEILNEYQEYFIADDTASYHRTAGFEKKEMLKYTYLFQLMNVWLMLRQRNINIAAYLDQKNYKNVAVYGMSHLGLRLVEELMEQGIAVDYAIDRNASNLNTNIKVILPGDKLEKVDAIIVTANSDFIEIEKTLKKNISCPILSLEDLIYETGYDANMKYSIENG